MTETGKPTRPVRFRTLAKAKQAVLPTLAKAVPILGPGMLVLLAQRVAFCCYKNKAPTLLQVMPEAYPTLQKADRSAIEKTVQGLTALFDAFQRFDETKEAVGDSHERLLVPDDERLAGSFVRLVGTMVADELAHVLPELC